MMLWVSVPVAMPAINTEVAETQKPKCFSLRPLRLCDLCVESQYRLGISA